jgi:hypothetical protein
MTPRTVFRIIIATVGLTLFFYGVLFLFDALGFAIGLADIPAHYTVKWYAARAVFEMVLGLFVMRGIPPFLDIAFPEDAEKEPDLDNSPEDSKPNA